jgi:hypothetical protein
MDQRIGQLNSGKFYAYPNGYNHAAVVGTLVEVEVALGLRKAAKKSRRYVVTVTPKTIFHFNQVDTVEVDATDACEAVEKARAMCQVSRHDVPNTYRAKLAN